MPLDDEILVSAYQSVVNIEGQILAHLNILSVCIFPLWSQLDRNTVLTSTLASYCIPDIATPAPLRPLDFVDGIRFGRPLPHICKRLQSPKEVLLAVWLEVWGFARGRGFWCRYSLTYDLDGAFSPWSKKLFLELPYALLSLGYASLAFHAQVCAARTLVWVLRTVWFRQC
jgi:hypothetical protein